VSRLTRYIQLAACVLAAVLTIGARAVDARQRYPVVGMVLKTDPAARTFTASIEKISGFMEAMTMPFEVRDAAELASLSPGAIVEFTLVVDGGSSWAEGIRVRRYESVEQDPQTARRLSLLKKIAGGHTPNAAAPGTLVPDFTLTDQRGRRVSLSQLRGRVVAINFVYTACQLPDFCLRTVNYFDALQQRFRPRLGRDLVLLTITFDPARDRPEVLAQYAAKWKADPDAWRFLTGTADEIRRVLDLFGVSAFPDDGLVDHSLHTAIISRDGRLVANIEGNQYSSTQLVDLMSSVLDPSK
jgi:protein SCO1